MSSTANGTAPTVSPSARNDRDKLFGQASRLDAAGALVQDVWSIFSPVELPKDTINLGQGFMNFPPPKYVLDAANEALATTAANHYSHPKGRIRLRQAISDFYSESFGRKLDVENEIQVTSGANEGMYSVWTAFLNTGDEVILFEPFFDQYISNIIFNQGVPIYVPMHPHPVEGNPQQVKWEVDFEELRRAITPRTKMIVVNTPHNPVAKVFSRAELEKIAAVAEEHNLMVMSDEVYDLLVFDEHEHVRFATLPGMWDRTITVFSAGKTFAATGWRVGWLVGPPQLIKYALAACTRIVFCSNSPMQEAAAAGLEQAKERHFFETQTREYLERRDVLANALERLGLPYTNAEGTYFMLLDISKIKIPQDFKIPEVLQNRGFDFKATWFMAHEIGVSAIPVSEFFCKEHADIGENYIRFAFCKDVPTLKEAGERLQKLKNYL